MGRPKKPESLKVLHGTYREDRDGGGISAPPGTPVKPEWLVGYGAEMWDWCVAEFGKVDGLLAKVDMAALSVYCQAWQTFHEARELIEEHGIVSTSTKGNQFQNPAVGTMNKAIETITRLGSKFGMTPSDRAALKLPEKSTAKVMRRQRA